MDAHFASGNGAGLSMCRICAVVLAEPGQVEILMLLHRLNVSNRNAELGLRLSGVANVTPASDTMQKRFLEGRALHSHPGIFL